jgi:hypothetical protein
VAKGKAVTDRLELSTGAVLEPDGDLVYLIDTLYQEIAVAQELGHTYGDIKQEIERVYKQMSAKTRKEYFLSSVFLNYVTYENEMVERLTQALTRRVSDTKKAKKKR